MMHSLSKIPHRLPVRAVLLATTLALVGLGGFAASPSQADVPITGYADLVEKVSPAVVFIEVTAKAPDQVRMEGQQPFGQPSPFDEFFKHFGTPGPFDGKPQAPGQGQDGGVMHALGSGFLISPDGEIVTNNHVVDGATAIKVRLSDGREMTAHVVGTDPMTDVALIKLEGASGLPTVQFGASDKLRVGDAVVAVGNPFGLGGTVTSGIVSALGRDINSGPYDNFIQTDAAINKGNSGGPLFNAGGEVVGMNTAIFSPSGGSVGIGFSVPADTIRTVVDQLRDHGSVSRGWLGVQIQRVNEDLAQAIGMSKAEGALVAEVQPDSPAEKAKLATGDVIVAVNGKPVDDKHGLPSMIADISAGQAAELKILRNGKEQIVKVTIGVLSPDKVASANAPGNQPAPETTALGISVQPLEPDLAAQMGLPSDTKGLLVNEVTQDGPNADRLQPGDILQEVAGKPVTSDADLTAALIGTKGKTAVLMRVLRDGHPVFIGAALTTS
jgi:serine protease Do